MGLAYLFALAVSLGTLLLQIAMGARDADHDGHGDHDPQADHAGGGGFLALFLTLRFWIFAALGFGMSGTLIHYLHLAPPLATFLVALLAGVGSGLFAALAFRMLKRSAAATSAHASEAVGRVGRVVVPCGKGLTGQVRIELAGGSVDLRATTDDERIAHGEEVLIEDVRDDVATVSRRPDELG